MEGDVPSGSTKAKGQFAAQGSAVHGPADSPFFVAYRPQYGLGDPFEWRFLAGTDQPEAARLVIDWLLSPAVQADIPLNMFVFPARDGAALPEVFERFAPQVPDAEELPSEYIADNIDEILSEWGAVMGR